VITVDDGWISTKPEIAPELRARGYPFTAFIYIHAIDLHSHHPYNLTWDDIASLSSEAIDIESHTYTHPLLSRAKHPEMTDAQYDDWLTAELRGSKESIESHTGHRVQFLAYPYGNRDEGVIAAAKAAGYEGAVTVTPGPVSKDSNPFTLNRYVVLHHTSLAEFQSWLRGP
jgi:peptidoglycan/xylan/chitin deacetylase (PgdA/CDA1 family)